MIVTDVSELRGALVDQMRGIPQLISLLADNPANIEEYVESSRGDLAAEIRKLAPPRLLVYLSGIVPSGKFPARFVVSFGVAIRADNATGVFAAMLSGVSEASGTDGQPLLVSTVHPAFDPMDIPSLERRSIAVDETRAFDFFEAVISFRDKSS